MKGMEMKTIVAILLILAVVIFSIMLATGALEPLGELMSATSIDNVLRIFGISGGS